MTVPSRFQTPLRDPACRAPSSLWNQLILSYRKGEDVNLRTFDPVNAPDLYSGDSRRNLDHVPDPSVPNVDD